MASRPSETGPLTRLSTRAADRAFLQIKGSRPLPGYLGRSGIDWDPKENEMTTSQRRNECPDAAAIAGLPHWARVAFGVRCAARVLPCAGGIQYAWKGAIAWRNVQEVIKTAANAAATSTPLADGCVTTDYFGAVSPLPIAEAANAAAELGRSPDGEDDSPMWACRAAAAAAYAAGTPIDHAITITFVTNAVEYASFAIHCYQDREVELSKVWNDFDALRLWSSENRAISCTPVPQTVFVAFVPGAEPEWWPLARERTVEQPALAPMFLRPSLEELLAENPMPLPPGQAMPVLPQQVRRPWWRFW